MSKGVIRKVAGPLVIAEGMRDANMFDVVRVSEQRLIGEIIEIHGGDASIQVYEETSGLGPGEPVESTGEPLSVELGPGLISSIYDGIERPLDAIMAVSGNSLQRGVEVPSLRERREDIPVLATAFLERFALANRKEIKGFTPQAMDALLKYSWPGNVRELENAVERAAILCLGEYISERELPMAVSSAPKNNDAPTLAELQGAAGEEPISMTLDEMERAAILRTLQDTGDNKSEAARRLGITRATLHNKLRRYDME